VKIILPLLIEQKLAAAMYKAGRQEIGGILMGEHVAEGVFRIQDATVQRQAGTFASFVRLTKEVVVPLHRFFRKTHHDYRRFNYLGEWHSHPSFLPRPSTRDSETMWEMLQEAETSTNFAVLLVVRLSEAHQVEGTATVYVPEHVSFEAELLREGTIVLSIQEGMENGKPV
jgi:[CysO sulfur-carrier protein]-S-L-cysteine hydrolase